jgi:cytochrome b6
VPLAGEALKEFMRGGEDVTGATLTRMFAFHVALLPVALIALLGIHLYLVQKQGMSEPISWKTMPEAERNKRQMKFFPNFFYRDLLAWVLALWVLSTIASLFPWELGTKADLFAPTPANVKPEWYFMFMFVTLEGFHFNLFGKEIALILDKSIVVTLFGILGVLLLLMPFIDRKAARGERSPVFTAIGWFAIVYITVTTIIGYMQ